MLETKRTISFAGKCISDLKWPWAIGLIVLAAASIVTLYERTASPWDSTRVLDQLNVWLRIYSSYWYLNHVYFLFCILLGASGIGEEISQRTCWLWLLRPRSRTYFVTIMEVVGSGAILFLWFVPVAFLLGARLIVGSPPAEFRSPIPLLFNAYAAGLTYFTTTRFLTFSFRSVRLGAISSFGFFILVEILAELLPPKAAAFLPVARELIEPGIVVAAKPWPYPVALASVCLLLCAVCYGLEVWRFRTLDIRV
jgi:ABC-type transport system involved in multi-copper enzyme maturation permease subunit